MKLKKLLAFFLSAVMIVTTSMAMGINASATLRLLDPIKAEVVFTGYTPKQLSQVSVQDILDKLVYGYDSNNPELQGQPIEIPEGSKVVFSQYGEKDYTLIENPSAYYLNLQNNSSDIKLLIGSGKQLDSNNKLYDVEINIVKKYTTDYSFTFAKQDEANRNANLAYSNYYYNDYYSTQYLNYEDGSYEIVPCSRKYVYFKERFKAGDKTFMSVKPSLYSDGVLVPEDQYSVAVYSSGIKGSGGYYYNFSISEENNITNNILNQDMTQQDAGYCIEENYNGTGSEYANLAFVYFVNGNAVYTETIDMTAKPLDVSISASLYKDSSYMDYYTYKMIYDGNHTTKEYVLYRNGSFSIYDEYKLRLNVTYTVSSKSINVVKIVNGIFDSLDAAALQPDLNGRFDYYSTDPYKAAFNNGVDFTIFIKETITDENLQTVETIIPYVYTIKVSEQSEEDVPDFSYTGSRDPYFYVSDVLNKDSNGNKVGSYIVGSLDDYYDYGYQTVFIDDPNADLSKILLKVGGNKADKVYDAKHSTLVDFNQPQDFSAGTVQYTVSTGEKIRNYYVTVKKKTTGTDFFVCGPSERTVNFDNYRGYSHDILVANLGDAELTNLNVSLDAAKVYVLDGVYNSAAYLDNYWVVGGENNNTLSGFESAAKAGNSLALIRIVEGELENVDGYVYISADGAEPVAIKITGHAGNPKIITESPLPNAVKYVPYQAIVATDNIYDWNTVTFELASGDTLPDGLELNTKTGEISGVPTVEPGDYSFTVKAKYKSSIHTYRIFPDSEKKFELTVRDNDEASVFNASDEHYEVKEPIGVEEDLNYFVLSNYTQDQIFTSYGECDGFEALWLNGEKLEEGVDYVYEEGSTVITIRSQVLSRLEKGQRNTIAAEFRLGDDSSPIKELKRTAQNFVIKDSTGGNGGNGGNNGGNGSSSGGNGGSSGGNGGSSGSSGGNGGGSGGNGGSSGGNGGSSSGNGGSSSDNSGNSGNTNNSGNKDNNTNTDKEDEIIETDEEEIKDETDVIIEEDEEAEAEVESDVISLSGKVVSKSGKALKNADIEIHSKVQTASTDKNGSYSFDDIEFGKHTITITDKDGNTATKSFSIVIGEESSISTNKIVAAPGEAITLNIRFDGKTVEFITDDAYSDVDSEQIPEQEENYDSESENPRTFAELPIVALAVSAGALTCISAISTKRKKKNSK